MGGSTVGIRVITGCTHDYLDKALKLVHTGKMHGVNVSLLPYDDVGTWIGNTRQKPAVIRRARAKFPDDILMWVDADARIEGPFEEHLEATLIGGEQDIYAPFKGHVSPNRKYYVGTLVFMPTEGSNLFLRVWANASANLKTGSDEWSFELVRRQLEFVKIGFLASRYAWVDGHGDWDNKVIGMMVGSGSRVVIRHGISGKASKYVEGLKREGLYDEHKRTV